MIQNKKVHTLLHTFFWLWFVFILVMMIIPTAGIPMYDFPHLDKIIHFGLFTILGFLFVGTRQQPEKLFQIVKENRYTYLLLLYAISLEMIQTLIAYRSFEFLDSLTNGLGIISGIIIGQHGFRWVFQNF